MAAGVIWALIGFMVCELTSRGRLVTTVVTAVAGASGVGLHAAQEAPQTVRVAGMILTGVEVLLVLAVGVLAVWAVSGRGRRRHGSAALASTRHVIYEDPETEQRKRRRSRTDRHAGHAIRPVSRR
jgi:hypothetical protein